MIQRYTKTDCDEDHCPGASMVKSDFGMWVRWDSVRSLQWLPPQYVTEPGWYVWKDSVPTFGGPAYLSQRTVDSLPDSDLKYFKLPDDKGTT